MIGCGGSDEDESQTEPTSASEPTSPSAVTEEDDTSSSAAVVDAGSGVDDAINASGGVVDLGGVQVRHESGVVVTLQRLVVEPSYVVLEFSAANGSADEVSLAGDTSSGITVEVDDSSAVMTYQAPSVNETLELSSGEVLEAEIVFLGVLPADATAMDITFNPEPEPDGDVAEPTIEAVDVPIAVAGG